MDEGYVVTHFEKLRTFLKSALNLGPSQRNFKKIFFSKWLISAIITHFENKSKINFFHWSLFLLVNKFKDNY